MKLLIVDDQSSVHKFLDTVFDWPAMGIAQVGHAFNGNEALELIRRAPPDLMILDIKMPYMDGIELIRELERSGRMVRIIILSAYNEFEYAREAMKYGLKDYVLKPIDSKKLGDIIMNAIREIEAEQEKCIQEAMNAALYGFKLPEEAAGKICSAFEHRNIRQFFLIAFLCRNPKEAVVLGQLQDELKRDAAHPCRILPANEGELLALVPLCREEESEQAAGVIREKLAGFRTAHGCDSLVAGLSEADSEVEHMRELYLHAVKATEMSFYSKEGFFRYSLELFSEKAEKELPDALEKNIIDSIKLNFQEFRCIELIGNYFDYFRRNPVAPEQVALSLMNLVSRINLRLVEEYRDSGIFIEDVPRAYWSEHYYIDDLELAFAQNVFSALGRIKSGRPKTDTEIIREVKRHIDEKYNEDLSLDSISERFFISKYQLSRIFKKEIGINYWDYITQVRMEKACLLIQNTDMKMYEIAEKTGYDDISHFSTAFKKYFGKSPKEFKAQPGENNKANHVPG